MENDSPRSKSRKSRWNDRFNTATRDLNAVLVVVAIGLAVLDFTFFIALTARDAMPSAPPARPVAAVAATTTAPTATHMSVAAMLPARPSAAATGW
ncbi:MAG TPA: hypothetical protein VJR70_01260 [Stellaceae bacterium]|nr:hypothetical protein [Stellaceae bacterium]